MSFSAGVRHIRLAHFRRKIDGYVCWEGWEGEAPAEPLTTTMHPRKHPTHGVIAIDNVSTIVFVTICTKDREPWLATRENQLLLRSIWDKATAWFVGRYVLMPDHLHLFASPGLPEITLEKWVQYWKSQFTKQRRMPGCRWQTDHWDYRLRRPEDYDSKSEYVVNNPVRHGLAQRAADWPFQGCIYELRW